MLVAALAQVLEALVETRKTFLEDVHLGEKELWVFLHVDVSVKLSEGSPERGAAPLAELAMEHDNGSISHHLPEFVEVLQESLLQELLIVDVYGTLYVTVCEFIVKPTVDNNHGMTLTSHQIGQGLTIDRNAGGRLADRLSEVKRREHSRLVVLLK